MATQNAETHRARWARFRFSIVGTLLASPPEKGQLQNALQELADKQWLHPVTTLPVTLGLSTIERWYYRVRKEADPVNALRSKQREDTGQRRVLSLAIKQAIKH